MAIAESASLRHRVCRYPHGTPGDDLFPRESQSGFRDKFDWQLHRRIYLLAHLRDVYYVVRWPGTRARAQGRAWRILHKFGLYFIGAQFALTLLPPSLDKLGDMNWWLVTLTVSAIGIRVFAFFTKRSKSGALAP